MECGPYRIEVATSPEDLQKVIDLRHHSFVEDFSDSVAEPGWIDFDQYDIFADHIIVKHVDTKEILGSYRIICSDHSTRFYSEEQFEISRALSMPGCKIELGRACIHHEHRNGVTLNLVWKGLAKYATLVNARYMFGCASVKTISPEVAHSIYWHLYPMFFNSQQTAHVLPKYHCPLPTNFDLMPGWHSVEDEIPTLLKSYLQAGAQICSEPALDTFFGCVDFFTLLDLQTINPKYYRRYF
jgi:putative hemolysin